MLEQVDCRVQSLLMSGNQFTASNGLRTVADKLKNSPVEADLLRHFAVMLEGSAVNLDQPVHGAVEHAILARLAT